MSGDKTHLAYTVPLLRGPKEHRHFIRHPPIDDEIPHGAGPLGHQDLSFWLDDVTDLSGLVEVGLLVDAPPKAPFKIGVGDDRPVTVVVQRISTGGPGRTAAVTSSDGQRTMVE